MERVIGAVLANSAEGVVWSGLQVEVELADVVEERVIGAALANSDPEVVPLMLLAVVRGGAAVTRTRPGVLSCQDP